MTKVLFLSEVDSSGILSKLSLGALSGGRRLASDLGAEYVAGFIGSSLESAVRGVSRAFASVVGVEGSEYSQSRYSSDIAAAEALCRASGAEIILAPHSSRISRVIGALAFRMKGQVDTHVADFLVEAGKVFVKRGYYKQRMEASLTRGKRPWFMTFDGGNFEPWNFTDGNGVFEKLSVNLPLQQTRVESFKVPNVGANTIRPDAKLLLVAGAGWTKKQSDGKVHAAEASNLILDFLNKNGASLGGSKSVVDQGSEGQSILPFMTHMNQVGQTGSSPRHPKGFATCCHGEEPHVIGWRFIKERRAVNLDPNCGWAQGKADVLYVADAFEVMSKVNELL